MGSVKINLGFSGVKEDRGFRYKDIRIPIQTTSAGGDLSVVKDMECIKESVRNIFLWKKGERILLPEYGNPLVALVDEPVNKFTESKIREVLEKAFSTWEPRVQLSNVVITPSPDENAYYVEVTYIIPSLYDLTDTVNFQVQ